MTDKHKGSYQYQLLHSDTSAIRLTKLLPGLWGDPIRCNLEHISLDELPQYEALSYMWGDVSSTTTISLSGCTVRITTSLELALRYLRREDSPRILWIDALCIDQGNIAEKNQKVPEMWRVFSHTQRVIAWVGESDKDSEAAFDSILALERGFNRGIALTVCQYLENMGKISFTGSPDAGESRLIDTGSCADTNSASRLIVGIDYGTTFTGVAFASQAKGDAISVVPEVAEWGLRMDNKSKVPSMISYSPSNETNELESWGASLSKDAVAMVHSKLELSERPMETSNLHHFDWSNIGKSNLQQYDWSSILKLLTRPYFGRVWVVQELFYAGNIFNEQEDRCVIMCGKRTLPRPLLFKAWQLLESAEVSEQSYEKHGHSWLFGQTEGLDEPLKTLISHGTLHGQPDAPEIFNVLRDATIDDKDRLARLITSTMSFQATDPRDKVYALLKIAGVSNEDFPVDYSLPANQVLRAVTIYAIRTSQTLRILEGNRHSTDSVTPSWIPDPSVLSVRSIEWTFHNRSASRNTSLKYEYIESAGLLHLQGITVGRIKTKIGPFNFGRGFTEQTLVPLKDFYQALDVARRDDFWRTLVMDLDRTNALLRFQNHPAPAEFGTMCDVFLRPAVLNEGSLDNGPRNLEGISSYLTNMYDSAQKRCFMELDNGIMGLGPYNAMTGDAVVILFGGDVCFTLRPKGDFYQLVGDCYVQGAMQGQMMGEKGTFSSEQTFPLC